MDPNTTHSSDKIKGKSLRFELELTPISEGTKEFSYAQLVTGISEQRNNEKPSIDPLADNEEATLAKIAKKFEEKYGPTKKKRLIHESDLIDRSYGYDPSDSFVDDSELYEDYVPPQLDTKCGGFYINTGVLEFKTLEDEDHEEGDFVVKKKLVTKKYSNHHAGNLAKHKVKLLALQKAQKNTQGVKCQQRVGLLSQSTSASLKMKDLGGKKMPKKELPCPSETRAACIPVGIGDIAVSVPLFKASSSPSSDGTTNNAEASTATADSSQVIKEQEVTKSPPSLPGNLPVEIQSKISNLEESILKEQQTGEGKLSNKARAGYNDQLVDIELACKKITVKERTAVFDYISSKVGISRQTISKRVKQILRKREGGVLEVPLQKLKEAVDGSMIEQLAQYEEEVKNRSDLMSIGDKLEPEDDSKMEDGIDEAAFGAAQGEGSKPKRLPRKRYKWTEDVKKLLCEVVRLKVESEKAVNRIRVSNGEELIMQFLEDKVRPLWPKGWMQKGILFKMSESAHKHFTSPQAKKSVLPGVVKPTPPSTPSSTPPCLPLSTPSPISSSTSLAVSLSTPLTPSLVASLIVSSTNLAPSPSAAHSLSFCTTPTSLSHAITIKKAQTKLEGDSPLTTTPLGLHQSGKKRQDQHITPSLSHSGTSPGQLDSLLVSQQGPLRPSVSQQGSISQHGLLTTPSQQTILTSGLQLPSTPTVSQQGSPPFQHGSHLMMMASHGSPLLQYSIPFTSCGGGQKNTHSPLPLSMKHVGKAASVLSTDRQSPNTPILTSLASKHQYSNVQPAIVSSSMASIGVQMPKGVSSHSTAGAFKSTLPSPSHITHGFATEMLSGSPQQRSLALSRGVGNRQVATAAGGVLGEHALPQSAPDGPSQPLPSSPLKQASLSQIISGNGSADQ